MIRRAAASVLLILVWVGGPTSSATAAPAGVTGAVSFLTSRQQANGAFFSSDATADSVAEAGAVVARFGGPATVVDRAMRYVAAHGPARAADRAGHAARIVLGVVTTGGDPRAFGGTDYVAALRAHYNPVTGLYDQGVYANALAVLGGAAADVPLDARTYDYFRLSACTNGGLSHEAGCARPADVDTTAMTVIALRAAGRAVADEVITGARRFLLGARNAVGGWGLEAGDETNANSTGLALSAVAALGERADVAPWRSGSRDPLRALRALQLPSGAFAYMAGQRANDYATVQAVPGLAAATYPLSRTVVAAHQTTRVPAGEVAQGGGPGTTLAAGAPVAQGTTAPPSIEATPSPEASRQERVERTLGDRSTGSGARVLVLWLSLLIGGALIAVPQIIKKRRMRG